MRATRRLGAAVVLLAGLVGVPVALSVLGGPLLSGVSWSSLATALVRPDDGTMLIRLITVVGWLAWFVFAISFLAELVSMVSGRRIQLSIPGLGGPQRAVAGLLLTVLALGAAPVTSAVAEVPLEVSPAGSSASPETASSPATGSAITRTPEPEPPSLRPVPSRAAEGPGPITHVVTAGDDLWSLSERYYGQGRDWRKIAAANPDVLSGGPDRLQVGWRLAIPDVPRDQPDSTQTVVVRSGDTLSSIARQAYGERHRWTDIFDANRDQLDDPDELVVGTRLRLPARSPAQLDRDSDVPDHGDGKRQDAEDRSAASPEPPVRPSRDDPEPNSPVTPSRPPQPIRPTPTVSGSPQSAPSASTRPSTEGDASANHPHTAAAVSPEVALGLASVGGLLAAAVLGGLAFRRRVQLQARPLGRRILHAPVTAQAVETAMGHREQPLDLHTLDLAARAIAAHCLDRVSPLPPLVMAKVGPAVIELVMAAPTEDAPVGFHVRECSWSLELDDAHYLSSVPGLETAVRPFPALVSLGHDSQDNLVLVNLEAIGFLAIRPDEPWLGQGVLAAMAVELSFSPWADEMDLTLVGDASGLPAALGRHNVTQTNEMEQLLSRLERRAAVQRGHLEHQVLAQNRADPDLADPWAPEIVLVNQPLSAEQRQRLVAVMTEEPRVTMAAVVVDDASESTWTLTVHGASGDPSPHPDSATPPTGLLQPAGVPLTPQLLEPAVHRAVVELVAATGEVATTPAPWWDHGGDPPAETPPDNVTPLGKRFGGWGTDHSDHAKEPGVVTQELPASAGAQPHHPILRLLGPIELLGATGTVPPRAGKQCLEYCGWLLEHPGTTAQAMASALVVAEGTRRSNMSRLRSWLGADPQGQPYLPDAYTGRIVLHPSVSSDWQRLQILTAAGVNQTSTNGLRAALELVRGAPLADAAPGQWHWAEELRTDMVSVIRDIGVELATRALDDNDVDLARWAAARALVASPGDELLLSARIRTEHRAGNRSETERLTLQLAAQARSLGLDLEPETVVLLQEVMEGRVRARMA